MDHFGDKQTELNSSGLMILQQTSFSGKEETEEDQEVKKDSRDL